MATGARVRSAFEWRRTQGRSALVVYLTFGDPSAAVSLDVVVAVAEAGADVVELGVPFSDPNADGPIIQAAMERALGLGASLRGALDGIAALRAREIEVPIVLFGYYNPIVTLGVDAFAERAGRAGVDAVLTVDVPMDELDELAGPLAGHGVGVVPLVAPTSGESRIGAAGRFAPPFVYYISKTGVTGSALAQGDADESRVSAVRERAGAPVAVGFGIKTAADARRFGAYADGVVVGSALVERIADGDPAGAAKRAAAFVAELRAGLDG